MTDDLRARIAAAVARDLVLQARDCGEYQTRDCYRVADAVIAELGLREETNTVFFQTEGFSGPLKPGVNRRYVTDWIADE